MTNDDINKLLILYWYIRVGWCIDLYIYKRDKRKLNDNNISSNTHTTGNSNRYI